MKGHCGCTCGPHAGDNSKLYCADNSGGGGGGGGSGGSGGNEASNGEVKLTPAIVKASKSIKALKLQSDAASHPKQPSSVYTVGGGYDSRKKSVVAALKRAGMSAAQVKLGLAIAMQETNEFKGRDATKQGESAVSFAHADTAPLQRTRPPRTGARLVPVLCALSSSSIRTSRSST